MLEGLTDHEEFGTLGMILMVASPTLCPKAKERQNLLLAQNSLLQQVIGNTPTFDAFRSNLSTLVPTISSQRPQPLFGTAARSVAQAQIALPGVTLAAGNIGSNSLVPVNVNWLQFGSGSVGAVDVKAEKFASASTGQHTDITNGLSDLAAQSFFGSHYVQLALGGRTWWQLCIRPSTTNLFAGYACGFRFRVFIDPSAAATLNSLLWTRGEGCVSFFGTQVSVAASLTHGDAHFSVDGEPWSGTYHFDLSYMTDRFTVYSRTGLAERTHTLCVENGARGRTLGRSTLLDVIAIS
jgi:hypothetical protein